MANSHSLPRPWSPATMPWIGQT